MDEFWDIYDENRTKLEGVHKRGEKIPTGQRHIVMHLCIFDKNNKLLIQKRTKSKGKFSELWDVSVGGSALAGETSAQGIKRECAEELGLTLPLERFYVLMTLHGPHYFDDYYVIHEDVDLNSLKLQKDEVEEVRWASREEVLHLLHSDQFVPWQESFITFLFNIASADVFQGMIAR